MPSFSSLKSSPNLQSVPIAPHIWHSNVIYPTLIWINFHMPPSHNWFENGFTFCLNALWTYPILSDSLHLVILYPPQYRSLLPTITSICDVMALLRQHWLSCMVHWYQYHWSCDQLPSLPGYICTNGSPISNHVIRCTYYTLLTSDQSDHYQVTMWSCCHGDDRATSTAVCGLIIPSLVFSNVPWLFINQIITSSSQGSRVFWNSPLLLFKLNLT